MQYAFVHVKKKKKKMTVMRLLALLTPTQNLLYFHTVIAL